MTSTALRSLLAALVALVVLAPAGAAAQPVGSGSSGGGSGGRSCQTSPGTTVEDGYVSTWKTKYMRGSETCTDGTLCTSTGTLQGDNKTMVWRYECTDANGQKSRTVTRCTTTLRVKRCRVISTIRTRVSPTAASPSATTGPATTEPSGGTVTVPASPAIRTTDALRASAGTVKLG